jgi:hypothetical protein
MSFVACASHDKAVDHDRGLEFSFKSGAYKHRYFELSRGSDSVDVLALVSWRSPTTEEKQRWPNLPNVVVYNVMHPIQLWNLSDADTQQLISEALLAYEGLTPSSRMRLAEVVFNDPRYMDTGD